MADMSSPIAAAFGYAAEKFLRVHGNGPYDGLKTIGDTCGKGWAMTVNNTVNKERIGNIPYAHIMLFRDGMPFGLIHPYDGSIVEIDGELGKSEQEFISWCRDDEVRL